MQLDYLAREDLQWRKRFVSGPWLLTVYPQNLTKNNPALTLSTQLGEHWLTLWTYHQICEVIDSYVNLGNVRTSNTLKSLEVCGDQCKSLQAIISKSSGNYTLLNLKPNARARTVEEFLTYFQHTIL